MNHYDGLLTHQDIKNITGRDTIVNSLIPLIAGLYQATDLPTIEYVQSMINLELSQTEYQNILKLFLSRLNARTKNNNPMDTTNSTVPQSSQNMPHENYNYQTTANVPNYQQQSSSQRS